MKNLELVRIVSRKSKLAMWQTNFIADQIRAHHGVTIEIVTMDTLGDRVLDKPLPKIGAKGLFTKELEEALLEGRAELAVHSLKDLPSELPAGLTWCGSTERADPTDALVAPNALDFASLREGAVIATGSVRRRAQILNARPDVQFRELRGNIDTRLEKLRDNGWDAIIMATAALNRMERPELITERLATDTFVPAVSQGAIGLEIADGRDDVLALLAPILCETTTKACTAERFFMNRLQGGCSVSLGAYARQEEGKWRFDAWVSDPAGARFLRDSFEGADPQQLAHEAVESFLSRGATDIMGRE